MLTTMCHFFSIRHYRVTDYITLSIKRKTLNLWLLYCGIDIRCRYSASLKLMVNHSIMIVNGTLENRLFFAIFAFLHNVDSGYFSLGGEGHCNGGRFLVQLPILLSLLDLKELQKTFF